ncbi:MAG: HlyD family efflux transporter periplasmic adaptor subunit, partial [Clostridia bacterium]|nr:HlyD family efflux transporter periplasmic adaptor subunit [Clostridia bacterium]
MSVVKKYLSYKAVRISGIFILVVGLCVGGYFAYNNIAKSKSQNNSKEQTVKVARGDIDVAISGTGTVQPISRYDIVPLVKGNILQAPFEEGMDVKLGDLLYKIDDSDLSFNIQKAENGIEKLKINTQSTVESIKDLNVYAPIDGRISGLSAKEGDQTGSNSKIAEIIEDRHIVATIPFIKTDVDKIKVGQKATVSAVSEWASCEGTVK